jgi:hypothetical protein
MGLDTRLQTESGTQVSLQFRDCLNKRDQLGIDSLLVLLLLLWDDLLVLLLAQNPMLS